MQTNTKAQWDIFCRVIDNYGDIGVCWRLSTELASRGFVVRLFVDDASALSWMSPKADPPLSIQILNWHDAENLPAVASYVVESFGCQLPETYVAKIALQANLGQTISWLNLEYLSAEQHSERNHLLPSPVMHGAGKGLIKTFFYPGFTQQTGGLLRESNLNERQATFNKAHWLAQQGIPWQGERIISLFCYESAALSWLIKELESLCFPVLLLVTAGKAQNAVRQYTPCLQQAHACAPLSISFQKKITTIELPYLTQTDFDHLLWASDFNFVRGEDSLVRAIWAGKPFVWQIYPQNDHAHHAKLSAFLQLYLQETEHKLAEKIEHIFHIWNGLSAPQPEAFVNIMQHLFAWNVISHERQATWKKLPNLLHTLSNHLNLPYFQSV